MRRSIFAVVAAAAVIAAGAVGIVGARDREAPVTPEVDYPTMPTFNALDFYLSAVPYVPKGVDLAPSPSDRAALAAAERAADASPAVPSRIKEGLGYPYYNRAVMPAANLVPFLAPLVDVSKTLALQGRACADRGDTPGLVDHCLDAIEMGQTLTRGATLWNVPIQGQCEDAARAPLWDNLNRLSAADCRNVLDRYRRIDAEHQPLAVILGQDKHIAQMSFTIAFHDSDWRSTLLDPWPKPDSDGKESLPQDGPAQLAHWSSVLAGHAESHPGFRDRIAMSFLTRKQVYDDYVRQLDAEIAAAQTPGTAWPHENDSDYIAQQLTFDGASQAPIIDAETTAKNRMLEAAVELRLYRLTHGEYPDGLSALGSLDPPGTAPFSTADPFAPGQDLRYRLRPEGYVVYSVGPNHAQDETAAVAALKYIAN